jgi:hypothetical protein
VVQFFVSPSVQFLMSPDTQPGFPGGRASRPGVPGPDRLQPRAARPETIKTILGYRRRPRYRQRTKRSAEWQVTVERPAYDLTIFKLHCGKLTLKIDSKGERVLCIEAVAHNTQELNCGRSLEKFPEVVSRLRGLLERFADALSCID